MRGPRLSRQAAHFLELSVVPARTGSVNGSKDISQKTQCCVAALGCFGSDSMFHFAKSIVFVLCVFSNFDSRVYKYDIMLVPHSLCLSLWCLHETKTVWRTALR